MDPDKLVDTIRYLANSKSHDFPWGTKHCTCCGEPLGGGMGISRVGTKPRVGHYTLECACEWPKIHYRDSDYEAPQCRLHRTEPYNGKTVAEYIAHEQELEEQIDRRQSIERLLKARKEVAALEQKLGLEPGGSTRGLRKHA